jgi:hypothetical protein
VGPLVRTEASLSDSLSPRPPNSHLYPRRRRPSATADHRRPPRPRRRRPRRAVAAAAAALLEFDPVHLIRRPPRDNPPSLSRAMSKQLVSRLLGMFRSRAQVGADKFGNRYFTRVEEVDGVSTSPTSPSIQIQSRRLHQWRRLISWMALTSEGETVGGVQGERPGSDHCSS